MLERLIKLTTLIGTITVFNGALYLAVYYQKFNINIFSYLDFTEILISFLNNIPIILTFYGIYILQNVFFFLTIIKGFEYLEKKQPQNVEHHVSAFFKGTNLSPLIQLIISAFFLIMIFTEQWALNQWLIYFFTFVGINLIQLIADKIENLIIGLVGDTYSKVINFILIIVLPFTLFTIGFAFFNSSIQRGSTQSVILIDNSDKIIQCDNGFKYIGKSNNYIFLYNIKSNESMSISLDDIKAIKYKN